MMTRCDAEPGSEFAVEVYGGSFEYRSAVLFRLHRAFAASGCWTVGYKRRGRRSVEYSFEVELGAVMELYCGLVEAGLELTEVSHRALTELCVLRRYEWGREGAQAAARTVKVRLTVGFLSAAKGAAVGGVIAALA